MKILIYILTVLTLIGCTDSTDIEERNKTAGKEIDSKTDKVLKEEPKKLDRESVQIESNDCLATSIDFLKLKDKNLRLGFFVKLDSIRKVQYPDNDQETSIMVDLTPEYLINFLTDIDSDSLLVNRQFEQEYHFNTAPKGYTDPKICKDKIAVSFNHENCSFRLDVYNTFLVQPDWCTESMVIYEFKIKNDRIVDFWRQEAG